MPEPAPTANLIEASRNHPQVLVAQKLPASYAQIFVGAANISTMVMTAVVDNTSNKLCVAQIFIGKDEGGSARLAHIELEPNESSVVEELVGAGFGPGDYIGGYVTAVDEDNQPVSAVNTVDFSITAAVSS